MKISLMTCGAVLSLIGGASIASAAAFVGIGSPVTLASLCPNAVVVGSTVTGCTGGTGSGEFLTAGDKTFNDFSFNIVTSTGITVPGKPPDLTQYDVQAGTYNGNYAIEVTGAFDAIAGSTGSSVLDITFGYDVTSSAGATIEDLGGHFNGACSQAAPYCQVSVTETGTSPDAPYNGGTVGQITIQNQPLGVLDADTGTFTQGPVQHLDVTKDIDLLAFGTGAGTTAQFSILDQYVSQIPEPSFYGLLAIALVGLFATYRREKRQEKQENI